MLIPNITIMKNKTKKVNFVKIIILFISYYNYSSSTFNKYLIN
jgi:hypothetical protein